jgi:hypothetical protein
VDIASELTSAVNSVTQKWAKQRKAEERSARSRYMFFKPRHVTLREHVFEVLPDAYDEVSDGDTLPAHARQLMYNARRRIQALTDQELKDSYFTQRLLPEFCQSGQAQRWNVVYDPRGTFFEPHTDEEIALGTISVRDYLASLGGNCQEDAADYDPDLLYPTKGPVNRFGAVLFLEKEGFWPLLRQVKLAQRYDLAIMSTKGMSNTASRELIDHVCTNDLPVFILRDCDAAGFTIAKTLTSSGFRYAFEHEVRAIDLGLRKADADDLNLQSESFHSRESENTMACRLADAGATAAEIQMIARDRRRIELNAFPSRVLVDFLERKLDEHGVKKVVPNDETLVAAWRRAYANKHIRSQFQKLKGEAELAAEQLFRI